MRIILTHMIDALMVYINIGSLLILRRKSKAITADNNSVFFLFRLGFRERSQTRFEWRELVFIFDDWFDGQVCRGFTAPADCDVSIEWSEDQLQ